MGWGDQYGARTVGENRRAAAEQNAREKARDAAAKGALAELKLQTALPHAEQGNVLAMRLVVKLLAEKYGKRIEVRAVMPKGAAAYANWATGTAVIPPIVDAATFAQAIHEIAHLIAGPCSRREPHRPDPSVTRWHHCVACERRAWEIGLSLVEFSRGMFKELQRGLRSYRLALVSTDDTGGAVRNQPARSTQRNTHMG
jgi:hypothetical protein